MEYWKIWSFAVALRRKINSASNGLHVALSQQLLSFLLSAQRCASADPKLMLLLPSNNTKYIHLALMLQCPCPSVRLSVTEVHCGLDACREEGRGHLALC